MTQPLPRLFLAALLGLALPAHAFDTAAKSAWVYDLTTDTVLLEKDADRALPPASMSKLMTIELLFKALKDGRVTMDTTFPVSEHAVSFTALGGSTMYLQTGDMPTVRELIHGMIINSGNDACVVVAEGLEGSEANFALKMTERGQAIGLEHSSFGNASGWPDPKQRMSMEDLGRLSAHLITEYPDLYPIFAQTTFNYKNRAPANSQNRNPLLKLGIGADGLKTGHTQEAGFGFAGSALQNGRRIVFVVSGLESDTARAEESAKVAMWAFNGFARKTLVASGAQVASAPVWLGESDSVALVARDAVEVLLPATHSGAVQGEVVFNGPLSAPIAEGAEIGALIFTVQGQPEKRIPLYAGAAVAEAGFGKRAQIAAQKLLAKAQGAIGG